LGGIGVHAQPGFERGSLGAALASARVS